MQLAAVYPAQDDLLSTETHPGSLIDAYVRTDNDCSFLSTTCSPRRLGHAADGMVFTVEGGMPGWAP